jgi:BMFP domain-containing protein YqiC
MTQTSNRIMDEFAKLMNDAAGAAQGVKREMETAVRSQMERFLGDMDIVQREEFEAVREMAVKAREENDALRQSNWPGPSRKPGNRRRASRQPERPPLPRRRQKLVRPKPPARPSRPVSLWIVTYLQRNRFEPKMGNKSPIRRRLVLRWPVLSIVVGQKRFVLSQEQHT